MRLILEGPNVRNVENHSPDLNSPFLSLASSGFLQVCRETLLFCFLHLHLERPLLWTVLFSRL